MPAAVSAAPITSAKFWAGERMIRATGGCEESVGVYSGRRRPALHTLSSSKDIQRLADEELMQLVRQGDPRAFETVYDRHGGASFSLAYRMVGNRAVAEDVVQEAFLSIWRSRLRYESERGSVRSWVLGIVHHRTIDALRRNLVHDRRRTSAEGLEERQEAPE